MKEEAWREYKPEGLEKNALYEIKTRGGQIKIARYDGRKTNTKHT